MIAKKALSRIIVALMLLIPLFSLAQTSNIYIGSTDQNIRGFGGMNFPRWISDLSTSQADKAFGTGAGQIGLSILRISVSPNRSDWALEVPTAQRARSHGAIVFGTPWSPPASMKTNGSTIKGQLRTDQYGAYANYLRDFANYMNTNGVPLFAVSVQNEPDFLPDYESCGWNPSQIRTFLDNNASVIPTRVMAPEVVHYNSSYMNTVAPSSQVDVIANHNYGGLPTRDPSGKEQWMTEHYTSSDRSANLWPDALLVGKEVHDFMVNGYSAYIWWYIRRSYGLLTEDGNVSKRGYVMSHFSKFVRPGFTRVRADATPTSGVSVSAYQDGNTLVFIAINQNSSSRNVTFNFSGNNVSNITKWETTASANVAQVNTYAGGGTFTNSLAGNSITTFRGTLGTSPGGSTSVWLEAECGEVGSLFQEQTGNSSSNNGYVSVESGNNSLSSAPGTTGRITYSFNVGESGSYTLWARVIAPNADDDSFWVQIDGGDWLNWNGIAPGATSWTWDDVSSYDLSSGNHTLTIGYREDGTLLDKLYITNTGQTPTGSGSPANNCGDDGGGSTGLVNNGIYEIEFQTDPGKVLDLRNGEDVNGAVLRPWERNGETAQQWIAIDAGNGNWRFVSKASASDRVIDLANGTTEIGTSIRLWENLTNSAQAWKVEPVSNGYYRVLSSLNTSRSWDVANCVMDGSVPLQLWDYYGTSCQLFKFNYISTSSARVSGAATLLAEEADTQQELMVYPNPSHSGEFNLVVKDMDNYDVTIFSTVGKVLFEQTGVKSDAGRLNTGLAEGVYILQVKGENGILTKKIQVN
ncbi:RICIN domain-containing protein [Fulvivirga sediminis]|uniref:RICIN domain-containing protein n=1 Tax=Fulvivirga sediminis TaxID=2803949 RepID=A0A937K1Y1_9BACT|nr:RICIN domain-containing protein [Fulvivirga sediminis]MBL3657192.1 RICIN domain-containing protein [Fulvivirga sediminis]